MVATSSNTYRQSTESDEEAGTGTLFLSIILSVGILLIIMKNRRKANHGINEEMDISDDDFDTYVPRIASTHNPTAAGYQQQPYVLVSHPSVVAYPSP